MGLKFYHTNEIEELLPFFIRDLPVYEFGVYTGNSLKETLKILRDNNVGFSDVFGFDSWVGLPEVVGEWIAEDWNPGDFSSTTYFNTTSLVEICQTLIDKIGYPVKFISGYFDISLSKDNYQKFGMSKASYINIDVDLYSSTCEVLDFCFDNEIIGIGTVIRYDDWRTGEVWKTGNSLAHKEKRDKYGAIFKRLGENVFQYVGNIQRI